ncbi:hypothetical protein I4U23_003676 [Adineta vaga]|nr:hypothetical protein I4U23_003676 [Adineta vaga]
MRRYIVVLFSIFTFYIVHLLINRRKLSNQQELFDCTKLCPYTINLSSTCLEFDSKHVTQHHPDFICQLNFRNMADWIYGWPNQFNEKIETTTNARHIAPCLPDGSIIYVSIWAISRFFMDIYPHLIHKFVLITGEGDLSSPNLDYLERVDSKIIHWFGQNGEIDGSKSKKFTHIPIGLQCYEMVEAMKTIYKQQNHHTVPQLYGDIDEPLHYIQPIDMTRRVLFDKSSSNRKNLLLINFMADSDGIGLRRRIWKDLCIRKNKTKSFITCIGKDPGVGRSNLADIYIRNRQYSFWLSPRGNGIDCHRTWEALYLDVIPIVWNSSLNSLYEDLPVIIIQTHTEITEEFLKEKLYEISMKKYYHMKQTYRMEKLRNAYWRRLILITIGAEHRQTKRIYRTEIDQDAVLNMTQGACETCEHLVELIHELIDNDGKCSDKNLQIIEQGSKVVLNVILIVNFGRLSRSFNMQFNLDCIRLDDIIRLENIIQEHGQRLEQLEYHINDCFDYATKLSVLWENEIQFQNHSTDDHIKFSNNNRTICCETYTMEVQDENSRRFNHGMFGNSEVRYVNKTYSHEVFASVDKGFLSKNKRYQTIRFNVHLSESVSDGTLSVGIIYKDKIQKPSIFMNEQRQTWLLNVFDGTIEKPCQKARPYTWPIDEFQCPQQPKNELIQVSYIDLLFDTHHRYFTFRIQDQIEDKWAFYLSKELNINEFYPYVHLNSTNLSISIDS